MAMLDVKNLSKSFDKLEVLKDISFNVEKGEVVAIIGPSGSGKSTLLRCINQLERADGGVINVCGTDMLIKNEKGKTAYADAKTLREIRLKTGLVFQNFNLFPHMTVLRNITEAPVCVLKENKNTAREKAMELLKKMGLENKPEILFFDEPTSALDPELTGEILKVIKGLAKDGMTMVIVTHEMAFARDVADKVIFMENGYIVEMGAPSQLFGENASDRVQQFLKRFNS